ncbi:MAG: ferritin family protein [Candidatus Omnitrophica bacterium]|nr:ferritin family protein [Candidatus Omnitrophota bacterium]
MDPVEALKLALSKEQEAIDLYSRLSVAHPAVKETFVFLIEEEQKHKKLLEKAIFDFTR